mmetsp:Transcript_26821/g.61805  ORF Transcript_26821/g.61805 Transcript_26821/m.61805 type:complete len:765 (+) Transcript_26821:38-2332(+)
MSWAESEVFKMAAHEVFMSKPWWRSILWTCLEPWHSGVYLYRSRNGSGPLLRLQRALAFVLILLAVQFAGWVAWWYFDPQNRILSVRDKVVFLLVNLMGFTFNGSLIFERATASRLNMYYLDLTFQHVHMTCAALVYFCAVWPVLIQPSVNSVLYFSYCFLVLGLMQPYHALGTPAFTAFVSGTGMWRIFELQQQSSLVFDCTVFLFFLLLHITLTGYFALIFQVQNLQLQQALEHTRSALDQKTNALSFISHECRTPLNGILGEIDLLLQDPEVDTGVSQTLAGVRRMGWHLVEHLDAMMYLVKVERGTLKYQPGEFDPSSTIQESAELIEFQAREAMCTVSTCFHPSLEHIVVGDQVKFRQIVVNLLSNAIKQASAGEVIVSLDPVENVCYPPLPSAGFRLALQPAQLSSGLVLQVQASGAGMGPLDWAEIFNAFSTGEIERQASSAQGLGFGLSICREMLRVCGGGMWVMSSNDRTMTYIVTLPVTPVTLELDCSTCSEQATPAQMVIDSAPCPLTVEIGKPHETQGLLSPSSTPNTSLEAVKAFVAYRDQLGKPVRVLCVDDNPVNRNLMRGQLKRIGVAADVAVDGQEAIEICESRHAEGFDAIFMDYHMPRKNGIQASLVIKQLLGRRTPICLVTADGTLDIDDVLREEGFSGGMASGMGVDSLLVKPVPLEELARHLFHFLNPAKASNSSSRTTCTPPTHRHKMPSLTWPDHEPNGTPVSGYDSPARRKAGATRFGIMLDSHMADVNICHKPLLSSG